MVVPWKRVLTRIIHDTNPKRKRGLANAFASPPTPCRRKNGWSARTVPARANTLPPRRPRVGGRMIGQLPHEKRLLRCVGRFRHELSNQFTPDTGSGGREEKDDGAHLLACQSVTRPDEAWESGSVRPRRQGHCCPCSADQTAGRRPAVLPAGRLPNRSAVPRQSR